MTMKLPPLKSSLLLRAIGHYRGEPLEAAIEAFARAAQRIALEELRADLIGATGGINAAASPPGQPGSYARGHYNGMLDAANAVRRMIEDCHD